MALRRRRRTTRLVAIAAVIMVAVVVYLAVRDRVERYVAGERTEGLVDTLARSVPQDHPAVRFTEVSAAAGIDFLHFPGTRSGRLPEDMGSGVALGDVDADGWTDAFLVNTAGPLAGREAGWPGTDGRSRLYRNLGDGTFADVTEQAGIELEVLGQGAAFCDVDSDGDLDLLVTSFDACYLFRNDGELRFTDVSGQSGVDGFQGFWTGIAVGDHDRDGAIDLYVCGYVRFAEELGMEDRLDTLQEKVIPALINPSTFEPEQNLLLRGAGDGGFTDVAARAGVDNLTGRSLGATFSDLDLDGWPDLYVANDVSDNALFVNQGDGTFLDQTSPALVGDYRGAMGLAIADFDGDRDLDMFVTHWVAQENALYINHPVDDGGEGGRRIFFDTADRHGLGQIALSMVGWATHFCDFDNDGRLDLYVVNGSTIPTRSDRSKLEPMRSQLFWNAGSDRGYFEVGEVSGDFFREEHVGRGGATFDYDLDGDEDLLFVLHGERARLLRNDGGNERPTVLLRLRQREGNRFALGAAVAVGVGGRTFFDVVGAQGSYLSQHAVGELAFGLGDERMVERVDVVWPDGTEESAGPFPADSIVTWTRGSPPRIQPLPGKESRVTTRPTGAAEQREFYRKRDAALRARLEGDLEGAVELYRSALLLWPSHGDCLYYLGHCLRGLGREREALSTFERLVASDPASSPGWMQVGLLRLPGGDPALDDLDAAGAAFERCHELNGEESRPIVQLGLVALLRDELAEARRLFASAAVLNPRSIEARYFGGKAAYLAGDREEAVALLREAHAIATEAGKGESVSSEGDTATGGAMLAAEAVLASPLHRWRTLGERLPDVDVEYGEAAPVRTD